MALKDLLLGLGRFFSFLILYTVGTLAGGSACCKASTYIQDNTNRINAYISMPQAGFEPTTPESEWVKTVHSLDCITTVISI
jgi:hypothetical protein